MRKIMNVPATYCGYDWDFSIEYIFALIQDHITVLFGEIGYDNVTLKNKYNYMWVFTKNKAKIYKRPKWNEEIIVDCNVCKSNKLLCYVRTSVYNKNNELLIDGILECCILDCATFKFVRLTSIDFPQISNDDIDTSFNFKDGDFKTEKVFNVTHLLSDSSRHLNNAKAMFPIIYSLSEKELDEIYSSNFEVGLKYASQAMYNTELRLCREINDNEILFKYVNSDDTTIDLGYIRKI